MNVMVISPHPDDAELGMGGSIARLVRQGRAVVIVDMTSGEPTPFGDEETRGKETAAANAALGSPVRVNLGLPNRWLEPTLANRVKLAEAVRLHRPDVMFIPMEHDAHPDHIATYQLAVAARFAAKLTKTDMAGQPHWPRRLFSYYCTHLLANIVPSFVLDVSEQIEAKMAAIGCYHSQFYDPRAGVPGRAPEMVRAMNRYFGQRIGVDYGEPFHTLEVLGLKGLEGLL